MENVENLKRILNGFNELKQWLTDLPSMNEYEDIFFLANQKEKVWNLGSYPTYDIIPALSAVLGLRGRKNAIDQISTVIESLKRQIAYAENQRSGSRSLQSGKAFRKSLRDRY